MRKHLYQVLNTMNDSFTYTVMGHKDPLYVVGSNGTLFKSGKQIGEYKLGDQQWHLYIGGELYMSGPEKALFGLPEFELKSLTALVNQ